MTVARRAEAEARECGTQTSCSGRRSLPRVYTVNQLGEAFESPDRGKCGAAMHRAGRGQTYRGRQPNAADPVVRAPRGRRAI